jgi:hypothetical protein
MVHRLSTRTSRDERFGDLRDAGDLDGLRTYLDVEYNTLYTDLVGELKESNLRFWDEEAAEFTGPVRANAIEGGTWRLKYGLPTPTGGVG